MPTHMKNEDANRGPGGYFLIASWIWSLFSSKKRRKHEQIPDLDKEIPIRWDNTDDVEAAIRRRDEHDIH